MKIGIISDTHSKFHMAEVALEILLNEGAEFIVHAGDIVEVQTLELLKNCGKRYIAVYGNNDAHLITYQNDYNLVQEPYYFKLADTKFKLMHVPFHMSPDAEVILFGHTHIFESEFKKGTLFLNPGEVCARDKPVSSCVMLEVAESSFEVTHYFRNKNTPTFDTKKFSYEREK
ncbi:YfcE family phosphodiesterase [Sulfurimonas sp. SAG-AH-194-I05]|nr:YfcE family phosphodiesterase [Sulfurimonas sp. SAG-AH-194-I05]MDF1875762.1 YfcE family phosphodiesterase [Sulfurimonas sp. SAG-AH-194-I05]